MSSAHARQIFLHALSACSIAEAFDRRVQLAALPLDAHPRIFAIALGKAALPMLQTLGDRLGDAGRAITAGICCAPVMPGQPMAGVQYFAGGHPLPNEASFASAQAALQLLHGTAAGDFVFFLISGGGSAMCELPLDDRLTLADTRILYQALVGCGATIAEINTVRKHFSAVKGGRLAAACPRATQLSLLVADVAPRFLDALASGPTLPDTSTVAECSAILDRYQLLPRLPLAVRAFFADCPQTPRIAPVATVATLLSSDDLAAAARVQALALGYQVVVDNHCDDWDYADAARYLLQQFRMLQQAHGRLCLVSSGEVTVRLSPQHGAGGRNQQFALACALAGLDGITVLSAGSDGIDGNSPSAGALADAITVERARALGIDAAQALASFDAYPLFHALGDTLITGPTHNNLRDLRIFLTA